MCHLPGNLSLFTFCLHLHQWAHKKTSVHTQMAFHRIFLVPFHVVMFWMLLNGIRWTRLVFTLFGNALARRIIFCHLQKSLLIKFSMKSSSKLLLFDFISWLSRAGYDFAACNIRKRSLSIKKQLKTMISMMLYSESLRNDLIHTPLCLW